MNAPSKPPRADVEILTLGCRLNAYESEAMRALTSEAALSNAVIVNTCAVTGEAVRQASQAIRRARRERPDAEIIVTGCAAQIDPQSFAAMPEVSRVIGNAEKMRAESFAPTHERVAVADIMSGRETASHLIDGFSERIVTEGGLDTAFAGYGYRGHVAFNEPPSDRWHKYSVDELAQSKTRVVPLLQDTLVAHSHRTTGGYTQAIPPMALTVGMADFLGARRIRLLTDGGA